MAKKKGKKRFNTNFKKSVRKNQERRAKEASSYGYLNLPQGVNIFSAKPKSRVRLDIMPYEVTSDKHPDRYEEESIAVAGELWYKRPFKVYRDIGPNNETVVSPLSIGKPCPIADYRAKRVKEGADKDELAALRPSNRNLYVVIPLDSADHEKKPHIWDISQYLFQNLLDEELEEDEDNAGFPDLEDGLTLKVRFDEGKFGGNSFAETSRIDFLERKKGYDESILDKIPNLDECLNIMDYDELEKLFLDLDDDDYDEDEEDETPKRKKKSAKKSKDVDEDDEDFDDDDFEDEDDDFDDDEDDDFDDDEDDDFDDDEDDDFDDDEEEEEEEPAPKKKKKSGKKKKKK